jgi:hypothetical protein
MHGVYEALTPEERSERGRTAAQASHQPEVLAERIGRKWPDLSDERRQEVLRRIVATEGQVDG